jgi:hypothetical protein
MIKSSTIKQEEKVVHMGEIRNAYKILDREPEGKRSL